MIDRLRITATVVFSLPLLILASVCIWISERQEARIIRKMEEKKE